MKNLTLLALLLPLLASSSPVNAQTGKKGPKASTSQTSQSSRSGYKQKFIHRRNGTPLSPERMRAASGKDIKLRTYRTVEASIENAPVRVDPVSGKINAYGAEVTVHNTVKHGIDFSQRAPQDNGVAKPLGPNQVRNSLIDQEIGKAIPKLDGKVYFPVAHPPNAPVVVQFKSSDTGHAGKEYSRVSVVKGKIRVKTIAGEGLFPKMVLSGGELAGEFQPYLNTNVVGVTPAFRPTGKRIPQVTVRGGVNAMPPGSFYRTVNVSTGKTSGWKSAHVQTGSFRVNIPLKGINDVMALEVRTGRTTTEGSVITSRWTFKAPFGPTEKGRMPLMKTDFEAGETIAKRPTHPITAAEHLAANAIIKGKLHTSPGYSTIAELYTRMGISDNKAERYEFSVLLAKVIKENPSISLLHGAGNHNFRYTLNGQQNTHRFSSDIASATEWTFE